MTSELVKGVYERLLDEELYDQLKAHPEAKVILQKIDDESVPHTYAFFVGQILQKAFRIVAPEERLPLLNRLIECLSSQDGLDYITRHRLLCVERPILTEIGNAERSIQRPVTPLNLSSLLTGQGGDPPLEHELRAEMVSADRVDILVSFIKWSGLRLLVPALKQTLEKGVPIRVLSTSYMGASDPEALEWLANHNVQVRVSYDTTRTRLHAKAFHFYRSTGFSTAYIGSANISQTAMTTGLEWTVKVTAQDMPQVLDRFSAEFVTYWDSRDFEPYQERDFQKFRSAIASIRKQDNPTSRFFAEISPRPFQQRILDAIHAARQSGFKRNLVVAATGTGKTVVSALDYRLANERGHAPTLLYVAHRKEILEQALDCFRSVMRDQNFGELLVDGKAPVEWRHVFASVQSLSGKKPWLQFGSGHFRHVVVDEAHHGTASSYRAMFQELKPEHLVGLTATPERMDNTSILPEFDDRITAEIRLPEALAEKLLCPFHYFGVADNIDLSQESFWRNGKYAVDELEKVYTGDDFRARQRVDLILASLKRYQPNLEDVKGVGFCASVRHAEYMTNHFNDVGLKSALVTGNTSSLDRSQYLQAFRSGEIKFVFTVDVLSEGVDIPEINLVLFLRPTESLTVFLQQLGRGLRMSPGKDCVTVLDFVGLTHRRYRLDSRFSALLMRNRLRLDREVESDFPNLPTGCNIQLERVARERVLEKIRSVLGNLKNFVIETIQTWENEHPLPLTFANFLAASGLTALEVLRNQSWSQWKALALNQPFSKDPDHEILKSVLGRLALRNDPKYLGAFAKRQNLTDEADRLVMHYLRWNQAGKKIGISDINESELRWQRNPNIQNDAAEVAEWSLQQLQYMTKEIALPFPCQLRLHASYSLSEINAALGLANMDSEGQRGVGVIHSAQSRFYIHLVTFHKEDRDFSPTTRYRDYPISATKLHWESQSNTTQKSPTGQNYLNFDSLGYTILFFARSRKKVENETAPFVFLGPATKCLSAVGDRPIRMVWELKYAMPAILLEEGLPV